MPVMGAYVWNLMGVLVFCRYELLLLHPNSRRRARCRREKRWRSHWCEHIWQNWRYHVWMHHVNSILCRVDIQDLFNEDMDAQADHYLMWSHTTFFSFLRAIKTHKALLELQRDFKGKSGNFSVDLWEFMCMILSINYFRAKHFRSILQF